jgi:hypothetical protein
MDAGYEPVQHVFGNVAYSIGVGGGILGSLKTLARGEIQEFSDVFNRTRHAALDRVVGEARRGERTPCRVFQFPKCGRDCSDYILLTTFGVAVEEFGWRALSRRGSLLDVGRRYSRGYDEENELRRISVPARGHTSRRFGFISGSHSAFVRSRICSRSVGSCLVRNRTPLGEPLRSNDRRESAQAPSETACDSAS